ncbi:MAG: hypothetical protein NTV54_16320 [Ignavibacteriales bacterium]|nr:hypothetical protein [Ignavibacteriales bacterium]
MLHDDNIDLIHRVLDGSASAAEEVALHDLRRENEEAENYCLTMADIYERLSSCQRIAAPSNLVDGIIHDLQQRPYVALNNEATETIRQSVVRWLKRVFRRHPN